MRHTDRERIVMNEVLSHLVFTTICFFCPQGSGTAYGASSRLSLVDRGAGYDASDTFIDDTEAVSSFISIFQWNIKL